MKAVDLDDTYIGLKARIALAPGWEIEGGISDVKIYKSTIPAYEGAPEVTIRHAHVWIAGRQFLVGEKAVLDVEETPTELEAALDAAIGQALSITTAPASSTPLTMVKNGSPAIASWTRQATDMDVHEAPEPAAPEKVGHVTGIAISAAIILLAFIFAASYGLQATGPAQTAASLAVIICCTALTLRLIWVCERVTRWQR